MTRARLGSGEVGGESMRSLREFFAYGMRGGANLSLNARQTEAGNIEKTLGQTLKFSPSFETVHILERGYRKLDRSVQTLCIARIGGNLKLRAIEPDGTEVVPTNDIVFTGEVFDFRQIGEMGFVSGQHTWTWDGEDLTQLNGSHSNPPFLLVDGTRLVQGNHFSGAGIAGTGNFEQTGAGAENSGDYNSSVVFPRGGAESGAGVVLVGEMGAEAHWVRQQDAADEVSSKTKIESFSYTDKGVKRNTHICAGSDFVYLLNEEGIHEVNPFSGEATNLAEGGSLKKYWNAFSIASVLDTAKLTFDTSTKLLCLLFQRDGARNNTILYIDLKQKTRDAHFLKDQNYVSLACVGNELLGATYDKKIVHLFSGRKTLAGRGVKMRYVLAWNDWSKRVFEKGIKKILFDVSLHHRSSFRVRLRVNGDAKPKYEQRFTTKQKSGTEQINEPYGTYTWGHGVSVESDNPTDELRLAEMGNIKCNTFSIEIEEESEYPFEIFDIVVQCKDQQKYSLASSMRQEVFDL